ncbi:MAG: TRAM domain-containing protein, partial [Erysipelotrichaceae bacterium]
MKKNDVVKAECLDYTFAGLGIVKVDNFSIFIKGLIKGEIAEVKIISLKKNYGYGKIINLLKTSEERIEAPCALYPQCGGCQILHMSYQEQLSFKLNYLNQCLKKIGNLSVKSSIINGTHELFHYRNKVQIPFAISNNRLISGFYRVNSHDIVDMNYCYLQSTESNKIYQTIKDYLSANSLEGIYHLLIKEGHYSKEVMIAFISSNTNTKDYQSLIKLLVNSFDNIKSIILNEKKQDSNVILGDREIVLYGND